MTRGGRSVGVVVVMTAAALLGGCIHKAAIPLADLRGLERAFEQEGFSRAGLAGSEDRVAASPGSIGVVVLQGKSDGGDVMVERVPAQAERQNLIDGLPGAFVLTEEDGRPQGEALTAPECARRLVERAEGVNAQWLLVLTSTTRSEQKWLFGGFDALLTLGVFPGLSQEAECQTGILVVDVPARRIVRPDHEREQAYQPANLWTARAAEEQTSARAARRVISRLSDGLEAQHDKEHPQERWKAETRSSSWIDG